MQHDRFCLHVMVTGDVFVVFVLYPSRFPKIGYFSARGTNTHSIIVCSYSWFVNDDVSTNLLPISKHCP